MADTVEGDRDGAGEVLVPGLREDQPGEVARRGFEYVAGVEFTNGDQTGVRLAKKKKGKK
jgi:hypothetical protein